MRIWVLVLLAGLLAVSGCARKRAGKTSSAGGAGATMRVSAQTNATLIVTPANVLLGRVARVNARGRYVVLNFPIGHLPAVDQSLSVYHQGLKTGEVRVTDLYLDDNVVADLVVGEAVEGDEVRDK